MCSPRPSRAAGPARLALACLIAISTAAAVPRKVFYRLQSATTLPGNTPEWDYINFDAARAHLFIGRRNAGVTVFDTARKAVVGTIARSEGADAAALAPSLDRGYTANEDGSTTIFQLSTLKTLDRVSLGPDNDSVFFDPVTSQVMFTQGDSRRLTFVDAASGRKLATLAMDSGKLDGAAPDGQGGMFVAERDRDAVAHVDLRAHRLLATWPVTNCREPTGLAFDQASHRVFVGCRGAAPVLAVIDAGSGRVVTTKPIGRGNDGVVFDAGTHEIYTTNGVDADLVIYRETAPNEYALVEATTTRPYARTMALDPASKTVFSVTAEGTADPARKINAAVAPFYPNTYFDGTFTVLEFIRR